MRIAQGLFHRKKTIYYIRRNIEADQIYIITNKRNFSLFPKKFLRKYQVTLINEEEIIPERINLEATANRHFTCKYDFGWYYQQFLKMGFALTPYAKDFYLIWDSDTIPLKKLTFYEQEKMVFTFKTEYHKPYFETIENLIGYKKTAQYSFIAEHMIISTCIMQELIQKIKDADITGEDWISKIIYATPQNAPNGFSEFETYGTYCYNHYTEQFITRELRTFREAGEIYSRGVSKHTLKKIGSQYDTISLESWSTPRKRTRRLRNEMEEHLIKFIQTIRKHFPFIRI